MKPNILEELIKNEKWIDFKDEENFVSVLNLSDRGARWFKGCTLEVKKEILNLLKNKKLVSMGFSEIIDSMSTLMYEQDILEIVRLMNNKYLQKSKYFNEIIDKSIVYVNYPYYYTYSLNKVLNEKEILSSSRIDFILSVFANFELEQLDFAKLLPYIIFDLFSIEDDGKYKYAVNKALEVESRVMLDEFIKLANNDTLLSSNSYERILGEASTIVNLKMYVSFFDENINGKALNTNCFGKKFFELDEWYNISNNEVRKHFVIFATNEDILSFLDEDYYYMLLEKIVDMKEYEYRKNFVNLVSNPLLLDNQNLYKSVINISFNISDPYILGVFSEVATKNCQMANTDNYLRILEIISKTENLRNVRVLSKLFDYKDAVNEECFSTALDCIGGMGNYDILEKFIVLATDQNIMKSLYYNEILDTVSYNEQPSVLDSYNRLFRDVYLINSRYYCIIVRDAEDLESSDIIDSYRAFMHKLTVNDDEVFVSNVSRLFSSIKERKNADMFILALNDENVLASKNRDKLFSILVNNNGKICEFLYKILSNKIVVNTDDFNEIADKLVLTFGEDRLCTLANVMSDLSDISEFKKLLDLKDDNRFFGYMSILDRMSYNNIDLTNVEKVYLKANLLEPRNNRKFKLLLNITNSKNETVCSNTSLLYKIFSRNMIDKKYVKSALVEANVSESDVEVILNELYPKASNVKKEEGVSILEAYRSLKSEADLLALISELPEEEDVRIDSKVKLLKRD